MTPEREPYLRIIVGILAVAAIPPLGVIFFDGSESLAILKQWQSGVGAFWGALFGLGAILIGALFNADLNRRRDDRLREEEARALAAALSAEMRATWQGFDSLVWQIKQIYFKKTPEAADLWKPTFPVYFGNIPRIGLLGGNLDWAVVSMVMEIEIFWQELVSQTTQISESADSLKGARERIWTMGHVVEDLRAELDQRAQGQVPANPPNWGQSFYSPEPPDDETAAAKE